MKCKSALMTDAAGSIGGVCAQMNHGSIVFRAKGYPTNPASPRQQNHRAVFFDLVKRWSQLTPEQVSCWNAYAAALTVKGSLGSVSKLTGRQHFLRSNSIRQEIRPDYPIIFDAPQVLNLGAPPDLRLDSWYIDGSFNLRVFFMTNVPDAPAVEDDSSWIIIFATTYRHPSVTKRRIPFRYWNYYNMLEQPLWPALTDYTFGFSNFEAGSDIDPYNPAALPYRVFFKAFITRSDGRLSHPLEFSIYFEAPP